MMTEFYQKILGILFILFLAGCSLSDNRNRYRPSEKEKIVDEILHKTAAKLRKENHLISCGDSGQMMYEVKKLGLFFEYQDFVDIEKGRELLIAAAEKLLEEINKEERIRPYLANYPFEPKNIEISIFPIHPQNENDPLAFKVISMRDGTLSYKIDDPNGPRFHVVQQEKYEEALKLVQTPALPPLAGTKAP